MAEQRCPHGFLRSAVACASCGPLERTAAKAAAPGRKADGGQYNFVDLTGTTIAGVAVLTRAPNVNGNARWHCVCECGAKFVEEGIVLRSQQKAGRIATCRACKGKHRKPRAVGGLQLAVPDVPPQPAAEAPAKASTERRAAVEQWFGGQDQERGIVERWWRVEIDAEGRMVKAEPVEAIGANGLGVIYVLAFDIKGARKSAFNEYCALRNKIRRARYHADGKCGCGRERDLEGRKCSECIRQRQEHKKRSAARARGEEVAPIDKAETYRKRLIRERGEYRAEVLSEVRTQALRLSPREFYGWLDAEIAAAGGTEARRVS